MLIAHQGELAALFTACCWTATSLSFEAAGKRVGSLSVNLIRLVIALFLLTITGWAITGNPYPHHATSFNWSWLALSAVMGFLIGDLCLFRAFVLMGARVSMLMMALVPPLTALSGWILLDEKLAGMDFAGMILTVTGVCWVIMERKHGERGKFLYSPSGLLLGFFAAFGQAVGLVMSKVGMPGLHPVHATQIRVLTGVIGFSVMFLFIGWWPKVISAVRNRTAMRHITTGAFFGPFLGVTFSLVAVKYAASGVAATIMAIVPVLIIPPAIIIFKEKISPRAILGAFLAIAGVGVLFM